MTASPNHAGLNLPAFVRSVLILRDRAHDGPSRSDAGELTVVVADPAVDSPSGVFDAILIEKAFFAFYPCDHLTDYGRVFGELPASAQRGLQPYGSDSVWVREEYDPVAHGAQLIEEGRHRAALEVLETIPGAFITEPERRLVVCLHIQLAYLLLAESLEGPDQLRAFFRAQQQFYNAVYIFPLLPQLYEVQAAFWRLIGDESMGTRLVHSIAVATGGAPPQRPPQESPLRTFEPPPWDSSFTPRVLIVGHRHSDYGMDVVYDGLIRTLGAARVVEYPYKPFLHGHDRELTGSYPCAFDHPAEPKTLEQLTRDLRGHAFDIILYADVRRDTPREEVLRLLDAGSGLPLFIVDTWDDGSDVQDILLAHLDRDRVNGYFKREMLQCWVYGPNTYPLPFAYPEARVAPDPMAQPREGFFWAGHRHFGLRRLYLEHLERALGEDLSQTLDPAEYQRSLQQALVALDLFGFGYDTVRYWEIPAHGAMLLAERKPIVIPHDFVHGESCVHFQAADDLLASLRHYLEHPDEAAVIARRGWEHLRAHHTSAQRARHLLGYIQHAI